jgi:hypothetical protein
MAEEFINGFTMRNLATVEKNRQIALAGVKHEQTKRTPSNWFDL